MTSIEVLTQIKDDATAREALELATVRNALDTASADARPVFADAAERAARALIQTRTLIAGLTVLVAEMTPPAPEGE